MTLIALTSPASSARTLVVVCGLIASFTACASESPSTGDRPTEGAQIYDRACGKCHGQDGSGGLPTVANGPKPIDLRNAEWQKSRSDEEITAAVRDGRGAMPPFADVLSTEQIRAVTAHVRRLPSGPAR